MHGIDVNQPVPGASLGNIMKQRFHAGSTWPTGSALPDDNTPHTISVLRLLGSPATPHLSTANRETHVLVVVDRGPADGGLINALRQWQGRIQISSPADAIRRRSTLPKIDLIVLYSRRSGGQCTELVERLTERDPLLPVIVVTDSSEAPPDHQSTGQQDHERNHSGVNAALLLQTMHDALRGPRIKRLIRLSGKRGGARFIARNARWLSEDLQSRYSTAPFQLPVHFEPHGQSFTAEP